MNVSETNVLLNKARNIIINRNCTYKQMAVKYGVDLEWLRSVAQGRISDPGVSRLESFLRKAGYDVKVEKI